jgi:large subunit ribosomal protein L10
MRAEKNLLLVDLKRKIDGSNAFFITKNNGIDPNADAGFRAELLKVGGEYEVVRKRIFYKAAIEAGIKLDESFLQGHVGVVFSKLDPVQTTKALFTFVKSCEDKLAVVGGHFDGQVCNAKDVEAISKLPSKDEMRAQLLSVFEAPLSHVLGTMDALLSSVVYCIDNKLQEQEQKS